MRIIFLFAFLICANGAFSQVYVQLEIFNDPKALKYSVGDRITYQVSYNPGVWNKGKIEEIRVDENTLILNNAILPIEDVSDFMLYRNSVKYVSGTVQTFGIVWLVQGSVLALFNRNTTWSSVLSIGIGSYVGGWIFRKLFYKIPVRINDKNRLRIVDTRFVVPESTDSTPSF